jgi:hypothetical protein
MRLRDFSIDWFLFSVIFGRRVAQFSRNVGAGPILLLSAHPATSVAAPLRAA